MLCSTRLVHREWIAHETLAIQLDRPAGFTWSAGQYADLTLPLAERDALGPLRSLSIASAPGAERLEFAMRIRDTAFKRGIRDLPLGTEILIEGPFDDLGFRREPGRPLVFVAGGVGIAPFMSVLREAAAEGGGLAATLFYANRRPEDAAYLAELRRLEQEIAGFRMVATMTQPSGPGCAWDGETDRPGLDLLRRHLPSLTDPSYYIVGTPPLLSQLRRALLAEGVDPADIGCEMYAGY